MESIFLFVPKIHMKWVSKCICSGNFEHHEANILWISDSIKVNLSEYNNPEMQIIICLLALRGVSCESCSDSSMSSVSSRFVPEGCFDVLEHTFQKYLEIKCSSIFISRGKVNDNNFWSAHIYEISNSSMSVKFIAIVSTHHRHHLAMNPRMQHGWCHRRCEDMQQQFQ